MNDPSPPPPPPAGGSARFFVDVPPSLIEIVSPALSEKSCDGAGGRAVELLLEEEEVEDEEVESAASFGGFCRLDQSVERRSTRLAVRCSLVSSG